MTDEQIKQAILGFTEFFKGITGNQNLEIPSEIAERYEIQTQADGEYMIQSAGDEIRQKNYDLISRQAVLDLVANYDLSMGQVVRGIHALPPIKPQEPKWIPVSERLPDFLMGNVIVSTEDKNGLPLKPYIATFNGFDSLFETDNKVIAWMPLPEPYREECEEV